MPGHIIRLTALAAVLAALAGVPCASATAPHRHLLQVGDGNPNNTLAPGVSGLLLQPIGTSQGAYGSFIGECAMWYGCVVLESTLLQGDHTRPSLHHESCAAGVVAAVIGAAFLLSCVIFVLCDRTRRRRQRARLNATGTGEQFHRSPVSLTGATQ